MDVQRDLAKVIARSRIYVLLLEQCASGGPFQKAGFQMSNSVFGFTKRVQSWFNQL